MTDTDTGVPTAVPADDHGPTGPHIETFETAAHLVMYDQDDEDRWLQSNAHVDLAEVR